MWCRPLNRILVAQSIAAPQMYVGVVVLPLHGVMSWLAVLHWHLGLAAAAYVQAVTLALSITLLCAYIVWSGLQSVTWGTPSLAALRVSPEDSRLYHLHDLRDRPDMCA